MTIKHWMSWEAGVDLVALTDAKIASPNVIVHVARVVHTPVGSAPAGMILWQPDPAAQPLIAGYVSPDLAVARYFGPCIFAGTPFEHAPAIQASIVVNTSAQSASAKIEAPGFTFETNLSPLGSLVSINRAPSPFTPFTQVGLEAPASAATLKVNGKSIALVLPPASITGGPAAVSSPAGIYSR